MPIEPKSITSSMYHVGWKPYPIKIINVKKDLCIIDNIEQSIPAYTICGDCCKQPKDGDNWIAYDHKDWTDCGWEYNTTIYCPKCANENRLFKPYLDSLFPERMEDKGK